MGQAPTEEVFQSAPPAKLVHHPDSVLFIMALKGTRTHTRTQMFIWLHYSLGALVWSHATGTISHRGYKLLNPSLLPPVLPPLIACLSDVPLAGFLS